MSSIGSVGSSSSNSNAAAYQAYIARQQAQKQAAAQKNDTESQQTKAAPQSAGDVDHDGDSH
ncbi:hypothetical protein GALL_96420 [mine drainage metagenome]|uniref:Uncharacterized protein n=1 Tax=mine drainage metagenome TaxID=410659 RepID=A0A1J5SVT8_9ZZZZ